MTWSRFDDAAPKSPKAVNAGNEAWSLWAAAVMYCNRQLTDGYVSLSALATDCLPVPITVAKAKKLAEILCDQATARPDGKGLFERAGSAMYKVHDFEDWNPLKSEVESKRKADRNRKRARADSDGNPDRNPDGFRSESDGNPSGVQALARVPAPAGARPGARVPVPSRPVPSGEEDPPTPFSELEQSGERPRDLFGDSLRGLLPFQREDVQRVFSRFTEVFEFTGAKLTRGDVRADQIAEAIDAYTETACMLVLRHAPQDGKVNGKQDEHGEKHESIGYIFGNRTAFERILREAQKREGASSKQRPASEVVAKARLL